MSIIITQIKYKHGIIINYIVICYILIDCIIYVDVHYQV